MLDRLAPFFEHVELSPPGWPVRIWATLAGKASLSEWPALPMAARPEAGRLGHGWGQDETEARRRSMGEMIEVASCCAWGDEPVLSAGSQPEAEDFWTPHDLLGFAPSQLKGRTRWNRYLGVTDNVPQTSTLGAASARGWLRAQRLDGRGTVLVPRELVLISPASGSGATDTLLPDTNGCATGLTPASALESALLELVERDATALWWYGGLKARRIDNARTEMAGVGAQALAARGREMRLIDITTDLGIPVAAALGCTPEGREVSAGFAARTRIASACDAAIGEMLLMELKVAAGRNDPGIRNWFDEIDLNRHPEVGKPGVASRAEPTEITAASISQKVAALCRIAFIDLTRPEFSVPVVRAISPDLCHWKPRLGRCRLTQQNGHGLLRRFDPASEERLPILRM